MKKCKEYQFFETPHNIAQKLVKLAKIKQGDTVLEPSAGKGRIACNATYVPNIIYHKTEYLAFRFRAYSPTQVTTTG